MSGMRRLGCCCLAAMLLTGCGSGLQAAPKESELGAATATSSSLVASFEVQDPLHCGAKGQSDWPPVCVIVTSTPASYPLTARLDYRPELTHVDAEEVWVRVYDGKLDASREADGTGPTGSARL